MRTKRQTCRCAAYGFPHRLGAGNCRWPDPPEKIWEGTPGKNKPNDLRLRGMRKSICRDYKLHPIRDRERIARRLPWLYRATLKWIIQRTPPPRMSEREIWAKIWDLEARLDALRRVSGEVK